MSSVAPWKLSKPFGLFVVGRIMATIGIKMVPALLGWYIYEITGSALALGILGLSEVLPAIGFALPAGVVIDTTSRHKMIIRCLAIYGVLVLALSVLTAPSTLESLGSTKVEWLIYIIVALTGWVRAYYSPASSAILAQLVQSQDLVRAATSNSMAWLFSAILGPIIAGLLLAQIPIHMCLAFASSSIMIALVIMIIMRPLSEFIPRNIDRSWASVRSGLDFVFANKPLLGSMALDMFAVLFGGAVALLPVFAKDILHVGEQEFGWLMAATYLGNFIALVYFYQRPIATNQGRKLIYAVAGFGVCILVFALSTSFWLSFFALVVSGLFDGVSMVVRSTIFQILVPDEMRGRVSSVSSIFINSSNELGQFESGVASKMMGTVPSVVFGGIMTVLIAIYTFVKVPELKELDYDNDAQV
jgi:MFS family permease